MTTTYNVVLTKSQHNPTEGYLRLRTITRGKAKDKSLKIKVKVKNWNREKQRVNSKEPNYKAINEYIEETLLQVRSTNNHLILNKDKSFLHFAEELISIENKHHTRLFKEVSIKKLKEYISHINKDDLLFSDIDLIFIRKYYNWLQIDLKVSTSNEYISSFKYFLTQAEDMDKYQYNVNPFKGFKRTYSKSKHKVLSDEELKLFFQYTPKNKKEEYAQASFGAMMYLQGIRVGDFLNLKFSNFHYEKDFYLKYRMSKTSKIMEVKLRIEALEYLLTFIKYLPDVNLNMYYSLKKQEEDMRNRLKESEEEYNSIQLLPLSQLKYATTKDMYEVFNKKLDEEIKKEKRKMYLAGLVNDLKSGIELNKNQQITCIKDEIMKLKEKHSNEYTHPYMRGKESTNKTEAQAKSALNNVFIKIKKVMDIKTGITNHQARHVFAQRLFESGANFHHISMALGHSSLKITENYREQLMTDEARDIVDAFNIDIS